MLINSFCFCQVMSLKNSKIAHTKIWFVMQMTSATIIGGRKGKKCETVMYCNLIETNV